MRVALFLLAGLTAPVLAQEAPSAGASGTLAAPPLPDPDQRSDMVMVGAGVGLVPDYEGSNEYRAIPALQFRARLSGISVSTRGPYLESDLIPHRGGSVKLVAGPTVGVRLNRSGKVKDAVVDLLPRRKRAIEVGGRIGVATYGLTNPYDSLSATVSLVKDINGAHRSMVISPALDFSTPLSMRTFAGATLGADIVANRYADTYYSLSVADSLLSGLPVHDAQGGLRAWKAGLALGQSLSGDLRKGWLIAGTLNYSRIVGNFRRSPIVTGRGSANQWVAAIGLGYTF